MEADVSLEPGVKPEANDNLPKVSKLHSLIGRWLPLVLQILFVLGIFIQYALLMVIFVSATGYLLSLIPKPETMRLAVPILFYDGELHNLASRLPLKVKDFDLARLFTVVMALIAHSITGRLTKKAKGFSEFFRLRETIDEMNIGQSGLSGNENIKEKLESLKLGEGTESGGGREDLLKILGEVNRKLNSMKRNLAFLAVDVVDSTGMKVGEETTTVEADFVAYKVVVEKAFKDNRYLKAAWTPDGVMACFKTANDAVKAGQQINRDLIPFNRDIKAMKRDFVVRSGVNAGKVAYDEKMPMEQMSDHVIDIAGHFQKYAPKGAICITKAVYNDIFDKSKFQLTDKKIDELESYVGS